MWLGYQQSLRACASGLSLNVDTASTVFLSAQPILQYILEYLEMRSPDGLYRLTDDLYRKANNACKNIKVGLGVSRDGKGFHWIPPFQGTMQRLVGLVPDWHGANLAVPECRMNWQKSRESKQVALGSAQHLLCQAASG